MRNEIEAFLAERTMGPHTDLDGEELAGMVALGLARRTNGKTTGANWQGSQDHHRVSVDVIDDGDLVGTVTGHGSTRWAAAEQLSLLAGYDVPSDD